MGANSTGTFALSVTSESIPASEEGVAPSREIRITLPNGKVTAFDSKTISCAINSAFHAVNVESAASSQTLETTENRRR